jgi:hypothetical protein
MISRTTYFGSLFAGWPLIGIYVVIVAKICIRKGTTMRVRGIFYVLNKWVGHYRVHVKHI